MPLTSFDALGFAAGALTTAGFVPQVTLMLAGGVLLLKPAHR
jgi:hypothetical protein